MARNNAWMSVSDLMTGLMVIFLFVAIAYIKRVQDNQSVLTQYVENRKDLHDKLVAEFTPVILRISHVMGIVVARSTTELGSNRYVFQ